MRKIEKNVYYIGMNPPALPAIIFVFLAAVFLPGSAAATQPSSDSNKAVITLDTVTKTILGNGMAVLVLEDHSAPVANVNVWVKTGYFYEPDGITGISHLLEHMFFKGTPTRPVGRIQDEVKSVGGYWNAGTIYDHTNYYITVPSSEITRALDIESDALRNSVFDPAELKKEQEVVIQEILRKYDSPGAMAWEKMIALSFTKHHLGRWRMGSAEQIRAMSRDVLVGYYNETYRPENIILAVAGDVDTKAVMADVERLFAPMPRGELKKNASPAEPPQEGLRFGHQTADITQAYLEVGFHAPAALDKDENAVQILASLLGSGKSSRLYRELKERAALVNNVNAGYYSLPDVGAFYIEAELDPANVRASEEAIFAQIERVRRTPPSAAELDKIKTAIEFSFVSSMEDVSEQASNLAYYESLGDYRLLNKYLENLREVTPEDVQRAAVKYLDISKASIQEYVPENGAAAAPNVEQLRVDLEKAVAKAAQDATAENAATATETAQAPKLPSGKNGAATLHKLSNGITVAVLERPRLPIISIGVFFPGGRSSETRATAGATKLMLRSTLKGTATRSAEQIQDEIEALGTSINAGAGPDYMSYSLGALARNLPPAMDILADVILNPAFPPAEIDKERDTQIAQIRRNQDSMYAYPMELARRAAYGDHSYGLSPNGYEENLPSVGREQLLISYNDMITATGTLIVAVGDVDTGALLELLESRFGRIKSSQGAAQQAPPVFSTGTIVVERKKSQSAQAFAFPAPTANSDELPALNVLRNVASGMGGRLYDEVREKNNLAYTVAAFPDLNALGGLMISYAATSPENEEKARDLMLAEWKKMAGGDISEEEFESARRYTMGIYQIGMQANADVRDQLAHNIIMGRGLDYLERYPKLVSATTLEQVKKAAEEYGPANGVALGVVRAVK